MNKRSRHVRAPSGIRKKIIPCNIGVIIQENQMETTIVYWGYMGIMENKMESIIMGYII